MSLSEPRFPLLSRRGFLLATAGAAVAAACGGDDDAADTGAEPAGDNAADRSAMNLVQYFAPAMYAAGRAQRLPYGLADEDGAFLRDTPDTVRFVVRRGGDEVGDPVEVERRSEGLTRPYYPLLLELADAGTYTVAAELDDGVAEASFELAAAGKVATPGVGDAMVSLSTPTTNDPRGVDPICTRTPACPLHDTSLDEALGRGRPVAFLVATPAYCQVEVCGPVLDLLLDQRDTFGGVEMVHAEVYTDDTLKQATAAVRAYKLPTEPVLYLAGADGKIRERLDNIYDTTELATAMEKLVS